jgi:fumagillin biosynthesis cytochrome P450 monooxygenase
VILQITYGYSITRDKPDKLVRIIEDFMYNISLAYVPLKWAVDVFPWLSYLPDWFPGMGFKQTAKEWSRLTEDVVNLPYANVRRQMADGSNRPSFVSALVEDYSGRDGVEGLSQNDETLIKNTAAIMYGGGADTTSSVMTCFLLAMVLYPDVQKKAQEEIDGRIPPATRLPELYDRDSLTYVNAVVKECHRWFPIVPMGQCHVATKNLQYGGYDIPKGSFLLPARWWFLHDPTVYSRPDIFEPGRFLEPRCEPDPAPHQFGYGRRACPGQYIASDTLFLTMARLLATFDIRKAVNENGRELEVAPQSRAGIIDCPALFPYDIRPRSKEQIDLIIRSQKQVPEESGDPLHLETS